MKMTARTIEIMVLPEGEPIFSEHGTNVKIDDEAGGEFVIVTQQHRTESGIAIDPAEWPAIREAIDKMVKECRGDDEEKEEPNERSE